MLIVFRSLDSEQELPQVPGNQRLAFLGRQIVPVQGLCGLVQQPPAKLIILHRTGQHLFQGLTAHGTPRLPGDPCFSNDPFVTKTMPQIRP